jgi:hypothetical protein
MTSNDPFIRSKNLAYLKIAFQQFINQFYTFSNKKAFFLPEFEQPKRINQFLLIFREHLTGIKIPALSRD